MASNASSMIAQPDTALKAEAWTQIYRMPGHQETRNRLAAARPILPQPARLLRLRTREPIRRPNQRRLQPQKHIRSHSRTLLAPTCRDCNHRIPPNATGPTSRHRRHHPDPQALTTNAASTCLPTASPNTVESETWQTHSREQTGTARAFNTPNAAGVSRDSNDGSSSDQRPTGQPAGSTSQRRDANGTTDCTATQPTTRVEATIYAEEQK